MHAKDRYNMEANHTQGRIAQTNTKETEYIPRIFILIQITYSIHQHKSKGYKNAALLAMKNDIEIKKLKNSAQGN